MTLSVRIYHYPEEWIGLRKSDADGEGFYWLDGTAVDHTNWQGGYPENATDGEECVIDATEYYGNGWKVGFMIFTVVHLLCSLLVKDYIQKIYALVHFWEFLISRWHYLFVKL